MKRELSLNFPPEFQGPPVVRGSFLDIWVKSGALQFVHTKGKGTSSEESKAMPQESNSSELTDGQGKLEETEDDPCGNLFSDKILNSEELIELCKHLCHGDNDVTHTTIGMVSIQ